MKNNKNRRLILTILMVFVVASTGCSKQKVNENQIRVTFTSEEFKNSNFEEVTQKIQSEGFEDVTTEEIQDLIIGFMTKDGAVEEVLINDNHDYKKDDIFDKTSKVVVRYHTFPTSKETTSDDKSEETKHEETKHEETNIETVITEANNADFKAALHTKNPSDPEVTEFITKYKGKTIQFDGYSWDWSNYTTTSPLSGKKKVYDTQYTTNFMVGDIENSETDIRGPLFRAEGVMIPNFSTTLNRQNMKITATVGGFDQSREFFILRDVKIDSRD
ncbi:DUF4839 domain-containing protein [Erysipelothrix inopinata]|uniref:DUF4839 domain-containing protein n=1 Tax=Erysipelothrix inopinata TaxID=225084 RepID=A0A7G9S1J4_9FIRM|nr:DUF4839 domain-containing protein [Erysipelothrix inopinata]QNN61719.1 DUF4839 domain-containing protein [Erysipelothrix inopinata]